MDTTNGMPVLPSAGSEFGDALGALIQRAEEYARPEPAMPKTTGNYEIVRGLLVALAVERDRADRAEARLGAGGSEWDSLAAGRDAAVNRIELVQAVLVRFEDGEIESLESAIREIDCVVNNTKDDELSEATA